jgi:hypothetical protein
MILNGSCVCVWCNNISKGYKMGLVSVYDVNKYQNDICDMSVRGWNQNLDIKEGKMNVDQAGTRNQCLSCETDMY